MDEKANSRLMLLWTSASRLPTVIVAAARIARSRLHWDSIAGKAAIMKRTSTAKPAAFEAVEMKAVMDVGAPSYTSGAQKWNGAAEILKPNPTSTSAAMPAISQGEISPARIPSARK